MYFCKWPFSLESAWEWYFIAIGLDQWRQRQNAMSPSYIFSPWSQSHERAVDFECNWIMLTFRRHLRVRMSLYLWKPGEISVELTYKYDVWMNPGMCGRGSWRDFVFSWTKRWLIRIMESYYTQKRVQIVWLDATKYITCAHFPPLLPHILPHNT